MNRLRSYYRIAAVAFLLLSTSGWAQIAPRKRASMDQIDLGKRISIDVNAVSPQEVFGSIASSLGCEFSVDSAVQQPVTLRVVNVTARTALSVISESIGCQYRLDGKKLVIEPLRQKTKDATESSRLKRVQLLENFKKPLPQGLRFENVPLSSVLEAISRASDFEITVEPIQADKRITIDVSGQTIQEALRRIISSAGAGSVVMHTAIDSSKLKVRLMVRAKK